MRISVVGTGYVGLVTGTCLAEMGNSVTCVDIDKDKVEKMNNGEVPIYEPGLNFLFDKNIKQDRLRFTTSLEEGIKGASIIFLALPTPPGADGFADLRFIKEVAEDLKELITSYTVVVNKSTVPVGTSSEVAQILEKTLDRSLFDVVSNPEFLREGYAVEDFMKPDRVIIGTSAQRAKDLIEKLYYPFIKQGNPILWMDEKSAEMTKYAANAYLATRITFMNEIANLCDILGADVDKVRVGMGSDTRIGSRFLFPGIGYGGSCFPKDVKALHATANSYGYGFRLLESVMNVNDDQKQILISKLKNYYHLGLQDKKIAMWGLAFKPNTDDIREAPALYIVQALLDQCAKVSVYDPEAMDNVKLMFGDKIEYGTSSYEILKDADALLVCTEWTMFRTPDFRRMKESMKSPVIFDGRNIYNPQEVADQGFYYESIGRPKGEEVLVK